MALHVFSVDVEDYYHVSAFERDIGIADWPSFDSRVVSSTQRLLRLLDRHGVQGTFFVLGWVAEHHPDLVRAIHTAGHEIGSHSYAHRLIYQQTPEAFRSDLRRSRDVLSDITGEAVTCYRAPSFSITRRSWWALEILVEEGFTVDSSIAPVIHDRYGVPQAPLGVHEIATSAGTICECPPSVLKFGRFKLGLAGGGYFRLLPVGWTQSRVAQHVRATQGPIVFYVHPWELDPEQPRLRFGSRLSRWRHYLNLHRTSARLDTLLASFRFGSLREVLGKHGAKQVLPRHTVCRE